MKITRQHFELVADVIEDTLNHAPGMRSDDPILDAAKRETLRVLADRFAHRFRQTNPAFKPARFMEACGFPE